MSAALARLARTRRTLRLAAAGAPLLRTLALVLLVGGAAVIAREAVRERPFVAAAMLAALLLLALVEGVLAVRAAWREVTMGEAALWVEGREPGAEWALATLTDPRARMDDGVRARLEARVARVRWEPLAGRAARRALALPAALALAGALFAAASPRLARMGALAPGAGAGGAGRAAPGAATRAPDAAALAWRLRVVPPAYAGQPARDLGDAASVAALVGSAVELRGRGDARELRATLDGRALAASADGDRGWVLRLAMPERPGALRVARGASARLLALEPRPDSLPVVTLRLPVRDTVVRAPSGTLALRADGHDDLGLVDGRLEYIVSSGEGESFSFRSGTLGARRLGGARTTTLEGTIDLAALVLQPGDIVHLRAVARDANPRGTLAASETRTLRVQRKGEADSVAVEAAPPPEADKSLISQRMLIRMTEALVARQPRLAREPLVAESRRIGRDQKALRKAVGDVVFMRLGGEGSAEHEHSAGDGHDHAAGDPQLVRTPEQLLAAADRATGGAAGAALDFEGDETPVVAVNRPLLEAYNAMWEASLALDVGEPREALPPMRRALEAIQKARAAERLYLRGRPPTVVVDLARVRLAGKERGDGSVRVPNEALAGGRAEVARRLADAAALAARDPRAAADSLLLLRIEALAADPALARALGDAADALRGGAGSDATAALVRARRVALGGAAATRGPGAWRGAWDAGSREGAP